MSDHSARCCICGEDATTFVTVDMGRNGKARDWCCDEHASDIATGGYGPDTTVEPIGML